MHDLPALWEWDCNLQAAWYFWNTTKHLKCHSFKFLNIGYICSTYQSQFPFCFDFFVVFFSFKSANYLIHLVPWQKERIGLSLVFCYYMRPVCRSFRERPSRKVSGKSYFYSLRIRRHWHLNFPTKPSLGFSTFGDGSGQACSLQAKCVSNFILLYFTVFTEYNLGRPFIPKINLC